MCPATELTISIDDSNGLCNNSWQFLVNEFNGFREAFLYNPDRTYEVTIINESSQFLNIKYKLGEDVLKTDLFREHTDDGRYWNFSRYFPHYAFCNTV